MIKLILCRLFGHKFRPTTSFSWCKDGANFVCTRCKKRVQKFENTKYKNRNIINEGRSIYVD